MKKDGSTQFYVGYRQLNNVMKKDSYSLSRIDDTLDTLVGCKIFSTLDLKDGYSQIELDLTDKENASLSLLCRLTVMPFGFSHAFAKFERLM